MTRKATLVAVVALLAVGTSAALAFGAGAPAVTDEPAAQETTTAVGQETTVAATANVTFQNQTSNGTTVVVEEVVVPEGGFVVIHAANATEEQVAENETEFEGVTQTETTVAEASGSQGYTAGEVLGNSTYLDSGTHENVTVRLDAPITESQVLIAMAHQDTNDNQQYEFPEADGPYTADGQAVTDWANVTVEEGATTTVADDADTETTEEM